MAAASPAAAPDGAARTSGGAARARLGLDHLGHVEWRPGAQHGHPGARPRIGRPGQRRVGSKVDGRSMAAEDTGAARDRAPVRLTPQTRHRCPASDGAAHRQEVWMQVGLMAPQGWKREYDGWEPAEAWARTIELAEQAEALGLRVAVGRSTTSTPCPTRPTRSRSSRSRCSRRWRWSRARAPRPHGRLHGLPEPGPDGQAGLDDRRHLRRALRAGDRGRLEGRRVDRLRLRLPDARRADDGPRRPPRGREADARAGSRLVRGRVRRGPRGDQRAEGPPAAADPDRRRRQRAERDVPATQRASPRS